MDGEALQAHHDAEVYFGDGRVAAVEVTAPPSARELKKQAIAESRGESHVLGGTVASDFDLGQTSEWLSTQLREPWAVANIKKLKSSGHADLHLVLYLPGSEGLGVGLSIMDATCLPNEPLEISPLTDLWVLGSAGAVLRYSTATGWSTSVVEVTDDDVQRYRSLRGSS